MKNSHFQFCRNGFAICLSFFLMSTLFAQYNNYQIENLYQFTGRVNSGYVDGNYAYMGQGLHLAVFDLNTPSNQQISSLYTAAQPYDIFVTDNKAYLYMAADTGLVIVDIQDPSKPKLLGKCPIKGITDGAVWVQDQMAYIVARNYGFYIVDVSNSVSPELVARDSTGSKMIDITVQDTLAFVLDETQDKVFVYSISDPENPNVIGQVDTPNPASLFLTDHALYVAQTQNPAGMRIIDVSDPSNPEPVGLLEVKVNGTALQARCIHIENDIGILGVTGYISPVSYRQLATLDMTDPLSPLELGRIDVTGTPIYLNIQQDLAYMTAWGQSQFLQMVDLSTPGQPTKHDSICAPATVTTLLAKDNYLYLPSNSGLWIYDLTQPELPEPVKQYPEYGRLNTLSDLGNHLAGTLRDSLYLLNITDPLNIPRPTTYAPESGLPVKAVGLGSTLFLTTGTALEIINIQDDENPQNISTFDLYGSGYDLTVSSDDTLAFVSYRNDEGPNGFQIVDCRNLENPASFDSVVMDTKPVALALEQETLVLGSNSGNWADPEYFLQKFDISNPQTIVKIGETNGAGMIMKLAIQNDIIYSAIFGGCVHTHDYATLSEIFRTRLIGTIYLNLILPYILTIQGVPGDLSGKVNVPNTWTPVFDLYGNSGVTVLKEHGSSNIQRRATSPVSLRLSQNYPNPFNAETTIRFYVQETSHVSLKIYNLLGCKVAELVNSKLGPGDYSQTFDASNLASGIYFYRIQMNDYIAVKKMVLLE